MGLNWRCAESLASVPTDDRRRLATVCAKSTESIQLPPLDEAACAASNGFTA